MTAIKVGNYDEMIKTLQVEVHDDCSDRLGEMSRILDHMAENGPSDGDLNAFRRLAHNLKGLGGSFGYPGLSQIAHRLESYVADMTNWSDNSARELQRFLDPMGEMLERPVQPSDEELARIVRALPTHLVQNFSADDMCQAQVEVLLVTPTCAIAKLLTQQINACGFRVNAVNDPVDGLTAALRARPDMIITSQEMRTVSGVDLQRAVRAISTVAKTPAALLTSKSSDRAAFPGLPEDVMLLRTGDALTDDFAGAIAQFGIG